MIEITILDEAERELVEAISYYESKGPGLGLDFLSEVQSGLATVRNLPTLWPLRKDGTRRYLVHRFPYLVIYIYQENHIWAIVFAHCKRKPGYWKERTKTAEAVSDPVAWS